MRKSSVDFWRHHSLSKLLLAFGLSFLAVAAHELLGDPDAVIVFISGPLGFLLVEGARLLRYCEAAEEAVVPTARIIRA